MVPDLVVVTIGLEVVVLVGLSGLVLRVLLHQLVVVEVLLEDHHLELQPHMPVVVLVVMVQHLILLTLVLMVVLILVVEVVVQELGILVQALGDKVVLD